MSNKIKLESVYNDQVTEILQVSSGVITFGREADNTIIIDSSAVSRKHGVLLSAGHYWVYRDFGSTNGSFIDEQRLPADSYHIVRDGGVIRIANFRMRLSYIEQLDEEPSLIVFYKNEFQGEHFIDPSMSFDAGGENSKLTLDGEDPSRIHFLIQRQKDRFQLQVVDLKNVLIVNGVAANGTLPLTNGDVLNIGLYQLIVNEPNDRPVRSETVEYVESDYENASEYKDERIPYTQAVIPSEEKPIGEELSEGNELENEDDLQPVQGKDADTVPAEQTSFHVSEPTESDGWSDDNLLRKKLVGRRFVFGGNEDETTSTLSMRTEDFSAASLGMSMSQKISTFSADEGKGLSERTYMFLGLLMLGALLGIIYYLYTTA